jgi:hypothetical protein
MLFMYASSEPTDIDIWKMYSYQKKLYEFSNIYSASDIQHVKSAH